MTAAVDAIGNRTTFGYDGEGRVLSRRAPSGHERTWTYDPAGRLLTATDGLANRSTYRYDPAGQLDRITLPRGGHFDYAYDPAGLLATETDPLGRTTTFAYDPAGRPTGTTFPSGRSSTADYDHAGRLLASASEGQTRVLAYDDAGRLASAVSAMGTLSFGYDNRGLMIRSTDGRGDTAYEYDVAHRLTRRAPPTGPATVFTFGSNRGLLASVRGASNLDYSYNVAGQVTSRKGVAPSSTSDESATYDVNGRLTRIGTSAAHEKTHNPAANTTDFTYDSADRLASATVKQGTTVISTTAYGWDADSNRTSVARSGQPTLTAAFDLADRITSTSDGAGHNSGRQRHDVCV
jgi:YD repeat-containing protein